MINPKRLQANDILAGTTDLIGIIQTDVKDLWRIGTAFTEGFNTLLTKGTIAAPAYAAKGFTVGDAGKSHFQNMNAAAENSFGYVKPETTVSKITPVIRFLTSPKVMTVKLDIIIGTPTGRAAVPFNIHFHFNCDRDFEKRLPGNKLIVTWEPADPRYGTIEQHTGTVLPALCTAITHVADSIDGIGYVSTDNDIVRLRKGVEY